MPPNYWLLVPDQPPLILTNHNPLGHINASLRRFPIQTFSRRAFTGITVTSRLVTNVYPSFIKQVLDLP